MKSYEECKRIVESLPIGYYLGGKVDLELSENSEGSYFDPITNHIVISYPMLKDVNGNEEEMRALLYHELSHVILTPRDLMSVVIRHWESLSFISNKDLMNLFEDERIETLLKDYYMKVNFKEFVKKVCKWETPKEEITNPMNKLYSLIRFDYGKESLIKEKYNLIEKWKSLNCSELNTEKMRNYFEDVIDFVKKVVDMKGVKTQLEKNIKNYESNKKWYENKINETNENNQKEVKEYWEKQMQEEESKIEQIKKELEKLEESEKESDKQFSEQETGGMSCNGMDGEAVKSILKIAKDNYVNKNIQKVVDDLLNAKLKKNTSGGYNTYSGDLEPSLIATDYNKTYKWFIREDNDGDYQANEKIKLNLFIDESGSMNRNTNKVIELIKTLYNLKSKHKNFNYDIITIGTTTTLRPKNYHYKAYTDNRLDEKLPIVYNQVQARGATNYNLVMFDGYCYSSRIYDNQKKLFSTFNKTNCVIITEPSNEKIVKATINNKNNYIITNNYVEELENNITKLLKKVIR